LNAGSGVSPYGGASTSSLSCGVQARESPLAPSIDRLRQVAHRLDLSGDDLGGGGLILLMPVLDPSQRQMMIDIARSWANTAH
jgi:hypothetical protein